MIGVDEIGQERSAEARREDQAAGAAEQVGPDPHPQIAQLLRPGLEKGHPGHVRTRLQQELDGIR